MQSTADFKISGHPNWKLPFKGKKREILFLPNIRIICFLEELIWRSPWTEPLEATTPRMLKCNVIAMEM